MRDRAQPVSRAGRASAWRESQARGRARPAPECTQKTDRARRLRAYKKSRSSATNGTSAGGIA